MKKIFATKYGTAYNSSIEDFLDSKEGKSLQGKVQLIFTSPPFPLVIPKKYGNKIGEDYLNWMASLAPKLTKLLKPNGSMVIEIGNAWDKGVSTMSTLPLKTLMAVADSANLKICQQLIWNNPSKLPGPAFWVNIKRERVTDSFTHIWWYSKSEHPKANNRPSGHQVSKEGFLTHNGGSIPQSVLNYSNTGTDKEYRDWCKKKDVPMHPARMPISVADFFIKFLTDPKDLVLDPFGGSCTTGKSAENLKRRWICIEREKDYLLGSQGRFQN
jgi:DNA modification methylase